MKRINAETIHLIKSFLLVILVGWGVSCWMILAIGKEALSAHIPLWILCPFIFPFPSFLSWPLILTYFGMRTVKTTTILFTNPRRKMTEDTQLYYTSISLHRKRQHDIVLKETPPDGATILVPHKTNQVTDAERPYIFNTALLVGGLFLIRAIVAVAGIREQYDTWLYVVAIMNLFAPPSIAFIIFVKALGYDRLGFKRLALSPSCNRILVYHDIVWTWPCFLRISVQRHVSSLHHLRMQQDTHKWDNWFGEPQPTLYLLLDHKKVPLPTGYTADEYQKIQTFIVRYIALFQRYIGITDVVFDTSHRESEYHTSRLWNPEVSDMIVPMPSLKCIQIYTERYDFYHVEQFMTYALNYLGQQYLKDTVDVHIIGPSQLLHSNLRNTLGNLCKRLMFFANETEN